MISNSAATASATSNSSSGNVVSSILLSAPVFGAQALAGGWSRERRRKRVFDKRDIPGYLPTARSSAGVAERRFGAVSLFLQRRCGAMTGAFKATPEIVSDYLRLFVNRRAYTLQSMRPHSAGGRHYYFRPTDKKSGAALPLTGETIRQHLEGEITVGLYAISPSAQRCKWVAIDADYKNAMEDLLKLQYRLWQDKVEPALEMSKRGGHLWILLKTPLLARDCRIYVHDLAAGLGVPVKGSGLKDGIEIFPRHNAIGGGEFGNAIRGPLGVHRGATRRFWFYGADYTLEAQMAYLNRLRKLTEGELQAFIVGKGLPTSASER